MNDLDLMLARLADAPAPAALAGIDAIVLERIAARRGPGFSRSMLVGAAFLALVTGLAGGLWPLERAQRSDTLAPFGAASPLAPSTLLASSR